MPHSSETDLSIGFIPSKECLMGDFDSLSFLIPQVFVNNPMCDFKGRKDFCSHFSLTLSGKADESANYEVEFNSYESNE